MIEVVNAPSNVLDVRLGVELLRESQTTLASIILDSEFIDWVTEAEKRRFTH